MYTFRYICKIVNFSLKFILTIMFENIFLTEYDTNAISSENGF